MIVVKNREMTTKKNIMRDVKNIKMTTKRFLMRDVKNRGMSTKSILFLITARKGSQGLPNKNMKVLGDFPLIQYSFDFAIAVADSNDVVCISTNDENISAHFERQNAPLHFMRPDYLAIKTSTSDSVIQHALDFFKSKGEQFEYVFLLQPTSPESNAMV